MPIPSYVFIRRTPVLAAALGVALLQTPAPSALYTPRSVALAYKHGTRSPDGKPGPRYWQNHGRYAITVTAAPPDRTVRGSEQITYWNESPDTLGSVMLKILMNNHRPGAPRNGGASDGWLTSGTHIDALTINGQPTPWSDTPGGFTVQRLRLPAALLPRDSVRLGFDWHYEISRESHREGMIDSTTYFLAYFYPRVAVYDDTEGWDTMDFTEEQEFYSDFNDYDVTVKAPANYVVWGTGTLVNPSEVLQPEIAARFQASLTSDQTIQVATRAEVLGKRVTQQAPVNAWHFTAQNVPDVTFAVSDHYNWDAASVVVDDATHRRAGAQAAYDDKSADYHYMVGFARHGLEWLSHQWPGVPYPYEKTTVVQGFAGMEYPMMVNDETYTDTLFSAFVAEHEIAHTWFPFYMGINETRYGFMDEGWATTFEYLIGVADIGKERADKFFKAFRVNSWAEDPSQTEDLPIITPGDLLKGAGLGNNEYGKAALGYLAVKDLLGDEGFRKCLHGFIERWHGKHPIPWDFFYTFNDIAGRNLNWFWSNWYFSNNYIDLAVDTPVKAGTGYAVTVRNIGGMAAPFDLVVHYTDSTSTRTHYTPAVWEKNPQAARLTISGGKSIASVEVDGGIWVDADPGNNRAVGR